MSAPPDIDTALEALRGRIDGLDERIVDLLRERAAASREVGEVKRSHGGAAVTQPGREAELLSRLRAAVAGSALPEAMLDRIYAAVLETSRAMQAPTGTPEEALRAKAASGISSLSPYQPGMTEEALRRTRKLNRIIKLASNENPLGPGPLARAAGAASVADSHRYPDGSSTELRESIGRRLDFDPACITIGAGSDNLFELIAQIFLGPGREAVYSQYAFAMYPINARSCGATPVAAPAREYAHDARAMLAALTPRTAVVFIANPNNPTGTRMAADELRVLLDGVPGDVLVVLDEAYIEYVDADDHPDGRTLLERYPNLVVTRTFSKIHGLGGLRVGYALASPTLTDLMNRARGPFNVARASQAAAVAALDDAEHIARSLEVNRAGYAQLTTAFDALHLAYIPSHCNFVTVRVPEAARVYDALLDDGIIVRPMASYEMPEYLRVSIGTFEENTAFLESLDRILTA